MEMDQETARKLLQEGGTFVLKNLPIGSEFGIDMNSYTVGDKFMGVKMIPPGVHFIYYSAVSVSDGTTMGPRRGFFHYFKTMEMLVRLWDREKEDISDEEVMEEEVERLRENLMGSLDQFLGPYDYNNYERWSWLSDYLTEDIIHKLMPECARVSSVAELIPRSFVSSKACPAPHIEQVKIPDGPMSSKDLNKLLPQMETAHETVIKFTNIDSLPKRPEASTGAEITKHSLDSSYHLEQIIKLFRGNTNVFLGELQFVFLTFLLGHVYDAFSQWKKILRVICTSNTPALEVYNDFYINFIRVFQSQLKEVEPELFVDIVNSNNFLLVMLRSFFFNLENNPNVSAGLKRRGERFREHLTDHFGWDFSVEGEDDDDEAPVVVET